MVVVGNIQTEKVSFNPGALILFSQHISGSHGYTPEDLAHCFELMRRGDLKPSIDRTLPLERAGEAHGMLAARRTIGRVVLVPFGLSADSPTA
jgi:D-arabinose 1-dehydrogenase-like Zn-dependent alcohol dehydrogenase